MSALLATLSECHQLTCRASIDADQSLHEDAPPAYSSPAQAFNSPSTSGIAAGSARETFDTPSKPSAAPLHPAGEDTRSMLTSPAAAMTAASSAISDAAATGQTALQQQLDAAKATIAQMQSAAGEGLRMRKTSGEKEVAGAGGSQGLGLQQAAANPSAGVPVQIVAALCLLSFLLAYFFF